MTQVDDVELKRLQRVEKDARQVLKIIDGGSLVFSTSISEKSMVDFVTITLDLRYALNAPKVAR